jgi:hypothetical protein
MITNLEHSSVTLSVEEYAKLEIFFNSYEKLQFTAIQLEKENAALKAQLKCKAQKQKSVSTTQKIH